MDGRGTPDHGLVARLPQEAQQPVYLLTAQLRRLLPAALISPFFIPQRYEPVPIRLGQGWPVSALRPQYAPSEISTAAKR